MVYTTLLVDNEIVKRILEKSYLPITEYQGLILQISALASQSIFNKKKTEVVVDLLPNYSKKI